MDTKQVIKQVVKLQVLKLEEEVIVIIVMVKGLIKQVVVMVLFSFYMFKS